MIQRIQTIWLLLAGIAALLTIQFPFYSGINDPLVTYHELTARSGGIVIMLATLLIAVLAFVCVALFKNRTTQLRLCVAAIIVEAVLIILYYKQVTTFTAGTYSLTAILHPIIIILFVLAARGINNDEKIIKDSNRLR
jgi:drug/metabolite transporter (DMT)-like permease